MSQPNYKTIAETIKKTVEDVFSMEDIGNHVPEEQERIFKEEIAKKLANCFDIEGEKLCNQCLNPVKTHANGVYECLTCNSYPYENQVIKGFKRKQFLEWFGVKE